MTHYPSTLVYHEAGHAVVGIQLGGRITKLSIRELDRLNEPFCIRFEDGYGSEPDRRLLLAHAITLYAGFESDKRAGFEGDFVDANAEDDHDSAAELLRRCNDNEMEFETLKQKVMLSAEKLVQKHWSKIEMLARQLRKHEEIPGYKVISMLKPYERSTVEKETADTSA
ncbi:MAG: hypothetical protein AB8B48_04810 [Pseudomonadales bacterium]